MRRIGVIFLSVILICGCRESRIVDYWNENGIDYSDVDAAQDRFAVYAELANAAKLPEAEASMDVLFDMLKEDEVAYYLYIDWLGAAFYNPLSPCRNPDIYAKAVGRISSDGILSEGERFMFEKRRDWSQMNKQGSPAVVPGIQLDGRRTLVLVVNLSCPSCMESLRSMASAPEWADVRRVAVCCGFGPAPETEGWEYTFLEDPSEYFDIELTPVYYVVSEDSLVESSYLIAY